MFKKLCLALIFAISLSLLSIPAFAVSGSSPDDSAFSVITGETQSFFVTITKPEEDKDTTYKKSYVISGNAKVQGIRVWVLRYNSDTKRYEKISDTDGVNYWDIGSSGLFAREFLLKNGENRIRVVAQKNNLSDDKPDTRTQITDFTITKLDKSFFEDIFDNIGNIFKSVIPF